MSAASMWAGQGPFTDAEIAAMPPGARHNAEVLNEAFREGRDAAKAPGYFSAVVGDLPGVTLQVADRHGPPYVGGQRQPDHVIVVEQDLPVRKYACWVPATSEMLADSVHLGAAVERTIDRHLRPWKFPDANPMPTFVPFPRLARAAAWWRRARTARVRIVHLADHSDFDDSEDD